MVEVDESSQLSDTLQGTHLSLSSIHPIPVGKCIPTTISRSFNILGIPTDLFVQIFADRIVVGISQHDQKIGNWCLCQAMQSPIDPKAIDFDLSTVLGDRSDAMVGVYARRITDQLIQQRLVVGASSMAVLLGISLKDHGKDTKMFHLVVKTCVDVIQEAVSNVSSN